MPTVRRPGTPTVLAVVGALVGLVFAIGLFRQLGPETGASTQLRGYVVESDTAVRVEFELARTPGAAVYCVLRARGVQGTEVGRLEVDVPPSSKRSTVVRETVPTTSRAVTGELVGCRKGQAQP
ncbi:MAG: hypothetical protein JWM64_1591 [Frankiales bacterium]|nr:hypothetical protein [Frankiales bacterium]